MKKEEKNELLRAGEFANFASIPLSVEILKRRLKSISASPYVPRTDFQVAINRACADLMVHAPDPRYADLYIAYAAAEAVILSMGIVQRPDPKLNSGPANDTQREERKRSLRAYTEARTAAAELKKPGSTIEAYHILRKDADSPELMTRMLTSPRASSKVITLEGKRLQPIDFPTRKLNSAETHRVRIAVEEVAANGKQAMVKITWAKNPGAAALEDLFERAVRLDIRRFDDVPNIADLLLSLRLVRREAEVIVSVTRALRASDTDLDLLVLKELLGVKELAAAMPADLRQVQRTLWEGLA